MKSQRFMFPIAILGVFAVYLGASTTSRPIEGGDSAFDAGNRKTWEPAVRKAQGELDALADVLISVVKDEARLAQARQNAVLLLGKIGSDKCLDFLVGNVSLQVLPELSKGGTRHLENPCRFALSSGDWRVVQPIFRSLEASKDPQTLADLGYVLRHVLSTRVALAAIEEQLSQDPGPARKANLEQLKEFLGL